MKATKLFAFLALCLVLALTGCDSGGGSSGGGGDRGAGKTFIVSDITPRGEIVITPVSGKGIKFTQGGIEYEIHVSLILNDNNTFTSTEEFWMDGLKLGDSEFTGTWDQNGSIITTHSNSEKDNLSGTTTNFNPPEDESLTLSADGKTLTENEQDPELPTKLVLTKQ